MPMDPSADASSMMSQDQSTPAGPGTSSAMRVYPSTPGNNPEAHVRDFHRSIQAGHAVASRPVNSSPALKSARKSAHSKSARPRP